MLLIAAGSLWLFLAAVPALADGGPHVASVNSGVSSLTADSCAGCHRVHTAQGAMLLKTRPRRSSACRATVRPSPAPPRTSRPASSTRVDQRRPCDTQLGALRGGGFDQARHRRSAVRYTVSSATASRSARRSRSPRHAAAP